MMLNIKRTCLTIALLFALFSPTLAGGNVQTAFAGEGSSDTICPD